MGNVIACLVCALIGVLIGFEICIGASARGELEIDDHDPSKTRYRFVIGSLDTLQKRKYILLKIRTGYEFSQK